MPLVAPSDTYDAVRDRIAAAARAAGRDPKEIALVAVSKQQPIEKVEALLARGQCLFGENRVQEAQARWAPLKARFPDVKLRLIGPLQTNKVREAVELFDAVDSVDREKLAGALADEMARSGRKLDVLIQVNTGEEPQKAGVYPADADAFIRRVRDGFGLSVRGLMCIPPAEEEPAMHFALLAKIAARNELSEISMG